MLAVTLDIKYERDRDSRERLSRDAVTKVCHTVIISRVLAGWKSKRLQRRTTRTKKCLRMRQRLRFPLCRATDSL